ncbi:MAG: histidine phosphatase family protein [Lachnospiraceae bacterium]|nr:histidine phosphatase family protein [Lachnospiraceae bacterium]
MMRILLIRHAEQASKVCNADVSLSETGRKQAEALAERLLSYGIDAVYSSPLRRAAETAGAAAEKTGLPVFIRTELSEMDFGELTGLPHAERIERERQYSEERNGALTDRPYPGGESYGEVYERIRPVLAEITASGAECAAVFSHLEALRAMVSGMIGLPFGHAKLILKGLRHTAVTEMLYDAETGRYYLKSIG